MALWLITCVIGRLLPRNGWKMADGQLLFRILQTYSIASSPLLVFLCFSLIIVYT